MLDSELDKCSQILHSNLAHQTTAIGIHGFGRNRQSLRDFPAGLALRYQSPDLGSLELSAPKILGFVACGLISFRSSSTRIQNRGSVSHTSSDEESKTV